MPTRIELDSDEPIPAGARVLDDVHDSRIVSQTPGGTAKQEPAHVKIDKGTGEQAAFREALGMTPDKTPANAPWWYQIAANASFATVISGILLWREANTPSPMQIQKDTVAATMLVLSQNQLGMEKLVDKFDRAQEKMANNIVDIKAIFRDRAMLYEKGVTDLQVSMRDMVDGARKYHESAEIRQAKMRALTEEQVELLTKIANAKKMQ